MKQDSLIILGAGYTARFMLPFILSRYLNAQFTSRDPDKNLVYVPQKQRLRFDLAQPNTWRNIPHDTDLLWCFPAAPLDAVRQFAAHTKGSFRRLVVLGSTSAYDGVESHDSPPPFIDETAPIDLSKPRVQGEEFLRKDCEAIVLRVAGIYGPGRNPLDWIKSGRVGPSRKYVNLIHVEDLAAVCIAALERAKPGEVYNVSDGTPRTWEEICETAIGRWGITSVGRAQEKGLGKRIDTGKLVRDIGYQCRHPDLMAALEMLDS